MSDAERDAMVVRAIIDQYPPSNNNVNTTMTTQSSRVSNISVPETASQRYTSSYLLANNSNSLGSRDSFWDDRGCWRHVDGIENGVCCVKFGGNSSFYMLSTIVFVVVFFFFCFSCTSVNLFFPWLSSLLFMLNKMDQEPVSYAHERIVRSELLSLLKGDHQRFQ